MLRRQSAGLLLYSFPPHQPAEPHFLLAHPGGPYNRLRDEGHWSIPKGELDPGEEPFAAACREFREETGLPLEAPPGLAYDLGEIRQKGGKWVRAWALPGTWQPDPPCASNLLEIEWPPRSGNRLQIPEIDRLLWAGRPLLRRKLRPDQLPLATRLLRRLLPYRIQLADTDAADLLAAIALAAFAADIEPEVAPEAAATFRDYARPEAILTRFGRGHRFFLGALGGEPCAMAELRPPAHLAMLFVHPHFRLAGLARGLLDFLRHSLRSSSPAPTSLTLLAWAGAVPAYRQLGFLPTAKPALQHGLTVRPMESPL